MDGMSLDLSQKILYTWQVVGVGAGYIGKKNTTSGCILDEKFSPQFNY
jgi:hypothetical protein